MITGGSGHEADDAWAEGRDDLHPPLQRCLQRRVQGGRTCRWGGQVRALALFRSSLPLFFSLPLSSEQQKQIILES